MRGNLLDIEARLTEVVTERDSLKAALENDGDDGAGVSGDHDEIIEQLKLEHEQQLEELHDSMTQAASGTQAENDELRRELEALRSESKRTALEHYAKVSGMKNVHENESRLLREERNALLEKLASGIGQSSSDKEAKMQTEIYELKNMLGEVLNRFESQSAGENPVKIKQEPGFLAGHVAQDTQLAQAGQTG